jgi:hypothetical protein
MVASGIGVNQIDSRCIAVAARYEDSLGHYDRLCERENLEPPLLLSTLRSRQRAMKEYLASLERSAGPRWFGCARGSRPKTSSRSRVTTRGRISRFEDFTFARNLPRLRSTAPASG